MTGAGRADTPAMEELNITDPRESRGVVARQPVPNLPGMRFTLAVLLAVVVATVAATAHQDQNLFRGVVYGVGSLTCDNWNTVKNTPPLTIHYVQLSWVEGFVTAVHNYTQGLKEIDRATIDPWISEYCERHPTESIVTAATSLALELADLKR